MAVAGTVAFQFASLQALPMRHGMSGRDLNAPFQGEVGHSPAADPASVELNRQSFLQAVGIAVSDLTIARQSHGTTLQVVTRSDRGRGLYPLFDGFPATDGLVTNDPSVAVGVIIADCVPLVLYDPRQHALAVVHAGWRGTVGLIAATALKQMVRAFGTRPADVLAGIGPSIGPCCYEVGREVVDAWAASAHAWGAVAVTESDSAYHFDLWSANRLALLREGVQSHHIEDSSTCVRCASDQYFSYRASRRDGAQHGRMLMVAQLNDIQ